MCFLCKSSCHDGGKEEGNSCQSGCCGHCPLKIVAKILMGLLLVCLVVYVGSLARNSFKQFRYIGHAEQFQNIISINGEGKVTGQPDIALVDIGLITENAKVAEAQKENTEKMNKLLKAVKALGIEEKDLQTSVYQISPKYEYPPSGKYTLVGYTVNQSITLKIRDMAKISDVLAKVGETGVNSVGNLSFTIDDPEKLRSEAREKALANARSKVETLTKSLGVKIVRVTSFNENISSPIDYRYSKAPMMAEGLGIGGGGSAPDIQTGTLEIISSVNVSYEIE